MFKPSEPQATLAALIFYILNPTCWDPLTNLMKFLSKAKKTLFSKGFLNPQFHQICLALATTCRKNNLASDTICYVCSQKPQKNMVFERR